MRLFLLSMTCLFTLTSALQAQMQPAAQLHCPAGDPPAALLCAALRQALVARGYALSDDAPLSITLVARHSGQTSLRARLRLTQSGAFRDGPEGVVSVMDRDRIPEASLKAFATALILRSGL